MIRTLPVAVFIAIVVVESAMPAPRVKEGPAPPNYYPAIVGTVWVYDMNNGEGESAFRVASVEDKDGAKVVAREMSGLSGWYPFERVSVSAVGLLKLELGGCPMDTPFFDLKFPVRVGDKWDFNYARQLSIAGNKGTATVLGEEAVDVPAGKFKTFKVEWVIREENGQPLPKPRTHHSWWAEGVGRVKITDNAGCELKLKSFSLGK